MIHICSCFLKQQPDPKLPFVGSSYNKLVFVGEKFKAYKAPRNNLLLFERCQAEGEISLWLMKVFSVALATYKLSVIPEMVSHLVNVKVLFFYFFSLSLCGLSMRMSVSSF